MKAKEVHKLSDDEITAELNRLRQKTFELRTQAVTEKIEDTSQFGKTRKDIARLRTEASGRCQKVQAEIAGTKA
jgi:large subunit ribosomal protein L29